MFDPKNNEHGAVEQEFIDKMIDSPNYYYHESIEAIRKQAALRQNIVTIAKQINSLCQMAPNGIPKVSETLNLWEKDEAFRGRATRCKEGKTKEALDQLLNNLNSLSVDCAQAALLAAMLGQYVTDPQAFLAANPKILLPLEQAGLTEGAEYAGEFLPGDLVTFHSPGYLNPNWEYENTIYTGKKNGKSYFVGQGISGERDTEELRKKLNEESGANVDPDSPLYPRARKHARPLLPLK
jgi:hypothetical protein